MFKFRAPVVVALALTCATSGVAAADPVPLPDVVRPVDTFGCATSPPKNCLHLTVALSSMSINSVPNMAATAFTREAFFSGIATATVAGDDPGWDKAVKKVYVNFGLQVGCQIKVGENQQIGNLGGGTYPIQGLPIPSAGIFLGAGSIESFKIDEKSSDNVNIADIKDGADNITLHVSEHERPVKVDSCAGSVSVRLVATGRVETVDDTELITAFGDIVQI